jgi:hypothetical protein
MFDAISLPILIGLFYLLAAAVVLALTYVGWLAWKTISHNLYCTRAKLQTVSDTLLAQQKILSALQAGVVALGTQVRDAAEELTVHYKVLKGIGDASESHITKILELLAGAEQRALLRPALAPMLLDLDAKMGHTIQRVEHGITVSANTQVMGGSAKGEFSRALTIIADKLGVDVSGKPVPAQPTILCSEYD